MSDAFNSLGGVVMNHILIFTSKIQNKKLRNPSLSYQYMHWVILFQYNIQLGNLHVRWCLELDTSYIALFSASLPSLLKLSFLLAKENKSLSLDGTGGAVWVPEDCFIKLKLSFCGSGFSSSNTEWGFPKFGENSNWLSSIAMCSPIWLLGCSEDCLCVICLILNLHYKYLLMNKIIIWTRTFV